MAFRYAYVLTLLAIFFALMLAGCQGLKPAPTTAPPPNTFQLTVTASPTGAGTITSTPAGISCPATCTANFAAGTQVTLAETAGTNDLFAGWGGACTGTGACAVTMNAATTVSATFNAGETISVTIASTPAGSAASGTVTSSPTGINCTTGTCSANFPPGTQVTLTETPATTPAPASIFSSWSGACTGITTTCTPTLSATAAASVTATFALGGTLQSLNHIIFFAQENRSFDHYFGFMRQYWANHGITDQSFDGLPQFNPASGAAPLKGTVPSVPGCNLLSDADSCTPDPTNQVQSFSFHSLALPGGTGTVCEENQSPFWNEARNDWDYTNPADQPAENPPPLNGFVFTAAYDARSNGFMDVNGVRAMGYFEDTDLNFYYDLATKFATSDRWFSPLMDRTQINRAYFYAATSQGYAYPPGGGTNDSKPFSAKTIFEALQDAGITWKIYVNPAGSSYNGVNCSTAAAGQAQDMCLAGASYMNQFDYEGQIQNASTGLWQHFAPISQYATDLQDDATFPQFAMIEPASNAGLDEHPSDADGFPVNVQLGAKYVEDTIIQPFLQSPIWTDSAMVFTFDEAGGLYDHVAPQPAAPPGDILSPIDLVPGDICDKPGESPGVGTCTFGWTGYRVPLVVISPFAKKNYVSHTVMDTTAVLALVEDRFGLGQLTNRDGSYKQTASAPTFMAEFFDFVNKPWATPPTPVPQNRGGRCDQTPAASWNEPPEITVNVTGSGQVTSSPASAINSCTTSCTGVFSTGTAVTLTATPNTNSTFTGWTGACTGTTPTCTLSPTSHDTTSATFNP
jgi:phospholipase C